MSNVPRHGPLTPSTLPGGHINSSVRDDNFLTAQCAHWGPTGLFAFSLDKSDNATSDKLGNITHSLCSIIILDMDTMQVVQTLSKVFSAVTCLLWFPNSEAQFQYHSVHLLVGGADGTVGLWDVLEGVCLRSIRISCGKPVRHMSFITNSIRVLIVTNDNKSFVYDSHLCDSSPIPNVSLNLHQCLSPIVSLQHCPLSHDGVSCVAWGDMLRIIHDLRLQLDSSVRSLQNIPVKAGRDYFSFDRRAPQHESIVDVCFSCCNREVLFVACRSHVYSLDWTLNIILDDPVIQQIEGVHFERIFQSFQSSMEPTDHMRDGYTSEEDWDFDGDDEGDDSTSEFVTDQVLLSDLPFIYSYSSDMKLTAWYISTSDNMREFHVDVRGTRLHVKNVYTVQQKQNDASRFSVVFVDGSVVQWKYWASNRMWCCVGYLDNFINRPVAMCTLGCYNVCLAQQNGTLLIYDARYGKVVKKAYILKSGNTKIVSMLPLHNNHEISLLVATVVCDPQEELHISILDARTMSLKAVIRRSFIEHMNIPARGGFVDMSTDSSGSFLLVTFEGGQYEVWNLKTTTLLYISHSIRSSDNARPFWCFMVSFLRERMKYPVSSNTEMIGVLGEDRTQFLIPLNDEVIPVSEYHPRIVGSISNKLTIVCDGMIMALFESNNNGGVLISVTGERTPLTCCPNSPVSNAAICPIYFRIDSKNIDTKKIPNGPIVCLVFKNGCFGVWEMISGRKLNISSDHNFNIMAQSCSWLKCEHIALLTASGSVVITDTKCSTSNSPFYVRAVEMPIHSPSFLIPTHASHLKTCLCSAVMRKAGRNSYGGKAFYGEKELERKINLQVSYIIRNNTQVRPFRNCFGQLIDSSIVYLHDELAVHCNIMPPPWLARVLRFCCDELNRRSTVEKGDSVRFYVCSILELAMFSVSKYFGLSSRQHFWYIVSLFKKQWNPIHDLSHSVSQTNTSKVCASDVMDIAAPVPFLLPNYSSETVVVPKMVAHNHAWLNSKRICSLRNSGNTKDNSARLSVSRSLLLMGEYEKAIEVLLQTQPDSADFSHHSQLAISVSAASNRLHSQAYVDTIKRVIQMLLVQGNIEGAVEEYSLIGEYNEICLLYQSTGNWVDAAITASIVPSFASYQRCEILHRWASHCALRGNLLLSVMISIKIGAPRLALVLLSEINHFTDTAGVFAWYLIVCGFLGHEVLFNEKVCSLSRTDTNPETIPTLGESLLLVLSDFLILMESTSNESEAEVMKEIIEQQRMLHEAVSSAS